MSSPTTTAYDYFVQVLECRHCGAPVTSPPSGGKFTCAYCDTKNVFSTRPELGANFMSGGEIDCAAFDAAFRPTEKRNAWVRAEASRPGRGNLLDTSEHVPADLRYLSGAASLLTWSSLRGPEMRKWWKGDTQKLDNAPDDQNAAARLYWLAMKLQMLHLSQAQIASDDQECERQHVRRRAVLETALCLLDRDDYSDVLRCVLSEAASHVGDPIAARGWLSYCDRASANVEIDSEIRIALCALYRREGKVDRIAELLGPPRHVIPIVGESRHRLAQAYRIHVYEALGYNAERRKVVREEVRRDGTRILTSTLIDNDLAPRTTWELKRRVLMWILLIVLAVVIPVLLLALVGWIASSVNSVQISVPL